MGFLKRIRSRSGTKNLEVASYGYGSSQVGHYGTRGSGSKLPLPILDKIFSYVCPHTQDETYLPSEGSMAEYGCMPCDLRDLAQASLVCSRWNESAMKLLYRSVRIDAVHYCSKEIELAEKRKRRSFFEHNADPKDAPQQRLQLFSRTVRQSDSLGVLVLFLKVPYMTRETCKADLAKTISVLPNLRYVDLPGGFFTGDPSCHMLRQELQARCPDIRRMKYLSGSEQSLLNLGHTQCWQGLEIVELSQLNFEITELLGVLSSLPAVGEVTISELLWLDDTILQVSLGQARFPPLKKLELHNVPSITAAGLTAYLSRPEVREALTSLNLSGCGVLPSKLHEILGSAPYLTHLSIIEIVSQPFHPGPPPTPLLASQSLETFHYEITSASGTHGITKPHNSYYSYLTESLWSGSLPALRTLYVRDGRFPESLVSRSLRTRAGEWKQSLDIFTKGLDELEWKFSSLGPITDLDLSPPHAPSSGAWRGEARRSMVVGNGSGGFLAVPPESSGKSGGKRRSLQDTWY
ncbi:MAG: hypothetical protein M1840_006690 [Geoglossum simile]|nr:MAG: hypothetical protein M1840_006690 [Geoglossum simile]